MTAAAPGKDVLVRVRDSERSLVLSHLAKAGLSEATQSTPGSAPAFALLDPDAMGNDAPARLLRAAQAFPTTPMLLLTGPQDRSALAALVEVPTAAGVIARDAKEVALELEEALMTLMQGARFGIERLVPAGAPRFTRELAASLDRDVLLEELEGFLTSTGIRSRMAAFARDAVEELVTNALYDAPTDERGKRIYAELDRRQAIVLPESARPRLDVALAGTRIAAVMSDPHGSLDVANVRRFLAQGLRGQLSEKPGGAGLGFARIYGLVDHLLVQVARGARTEIAFTLEAGSARRDPASRPTSLLMCVK